MRSLERRRLQFFFWILIDLARPMVAFLAASEIYAGKATAVAFMLPVQLLIPPYLTIVLYNRTYSLESLRDWRTGVSRPLKAFLVAALLLDFVAFFAQLNGKSSRVCFILSLLGIVLLFAAARPIVDRLSKQAFGPSPLNILAIDDGEPPVVLRDTFRVSASGHGLFSTLDGQHALDRSARDVVIMDQIIISYPDEKRRAWANVLKGWRTR